LKAYNITTYSKKQASKLGVTIRPSKNAKKKIDVFNKDGKKLASIGARGMNDFPTYKKKERSGEVEKGTANKRRALYKQRHSKDRNVKGTAGYFADKILW
jgi:hypothetical protein